MSNYIIEGIDNLGKSTLIKNIINELGYHQVVHYSTPLELDVYDEDKTLYQRESYIAGFETLNDTDNIIYDRFHLGECVYGPMYRGTSEEYPIELEKGYYLSNTKLILLIATNFDVIKDDGLSIDSSKQREEQDLFIKAFNRSTIKDKRIINVTDAESYRPAREILSLAL